MTIPETSLRAGLAVLASCALALGQASLATLSGRASLEGCGEGKTPAASEVRIVLSELSSGNILQEAPIDAEGRFRLQSVPFAAYRLEARAGGRVWAARELKLSEARPAEADLACAVELPERAVRARAPAPLETAGHVFHTASDIRSLPAASREKAIESVLLQSADVVPDEDGRLHVRGEDAQIQFVVDGIPWSGNTTRAYASLFNADMAKAIDVRAGGLPAQYAAGSAVVAVTTENGMDRPFSARASAGAAGSGTRESALMGSGRIGQGAGLFLSASRSGSERYLDPVSGFEPLHASGEGGHLFGKLTLAPPDGDLQVHLLGAYDATGYEVPNAFDRNPAQDQRQELRGWLGGARMETALGEDAYLGAGLYTRATEARLTSGGLDRLDGPADSLRALRENERFFAGASRETGYHGGRAELELRPGGAEGAHRLRLGLSAELNPLAERLAFAVTDSGLARAQADSRFAPYDLSHGGHVLMADESRTGWAVSAYVQDAFALGRWSFQPGFRYDAFTLFGTEHAFSPRLATAYAWHPDLVLRGSLDFMNARAPLENVLLSSSAAMRPLAGDDQGSTPARVGMEKSVVLDLGAAWRANGFLSLDAGAYGKYIRNFLVKAELGATGLIFPVNLKEGVVAGGQFALRLREWRRLSGSLSLGSCVSLGLKPEDGSSPVAAGLLVGEEGHNYQHPFAGEEFFPTEHNQLATAVFNLRNRLPAGLAATFGGRFDSGLPFDLTAADGSALDAAQSRAELRRRGYGDDVIGLLSLEPDEPGSPDKSVAPHAVFDLGLEYRLPLRGPALEVRAAVLNVLDTPYLYKFESSFGSTHFGAERTFGLWVALGY